MPRINLQRHRERVLALMWGTSMWATPVPDRLWTFLQYQEKILNENDQIVIVEKIYNIILL